MIERKPLGLSAHIGYLFNDQPLARRLEAARAVGFDAVEHPNPLGIAARTMSRLLDENGLWFSQMSAATGDPDCGEKGLASLPGREREFIESVKRCIDYAETIGCSFVHPMAGIPPAGTKADDAVDTYFRNIDAALRALEGRPVRLLIEAIGHAAVPGYYMHRLAQVIALSRSYEPGQVSVLVDSFHAAANCEDAVAVVRDNGPRIGHVHIADFPGRHEPGTGEIVFTELLTALKTANYQGALGFEYLPRTNTLDGLGWLSDWRKHAERKTTPRAKIHHEEAHR